jgi:oxazoline/thiazoline dehydrogenase
VIEMSLRHNVALSGDSPESVIVQRDSRRMRLKPLNHADVEFLLRLAQHPLHIDELGSAAPAVTSAVNSRRIAVLLRRLAERHLIEFDCVVRGRKLLTAMPAGALSSFDFGKSADEQPIQLSRFAYLHRTDGSLIIESPIRFVTIMVREPLVAALLADLAVARSTEQLCQRSGLPPEEIRECVKFLLGVGVLDVPNAAGALEEDTIPALAQLEFHDLVLHTHSRKGLTQQPLGGLFPFSGTLPPTPAVKQPMSVQPIVLPKPDIDKLIQSDMPFAKVMEQRKSTRYFGDESITLEQLGEFLYRVARIRSVRIPPAGDPRRYEVTNRVYPSGGAAYDLELYLTVRHCAGLKPGVYHYEALEHALSLLCEKESISDAIVNDARHSSGWRDAPHVVITLASRFSRIGWKYRGICYAVTLKNVGVMYEAMYLAATAMDLAPCALGGGDSALFALATGLDPLLESSVGEFMLGTLPSGSRQ